MRYEKLFSPITMRGVTFPNRIQRTSMVSGLSTEDGMVTEDLKKRYQREAKGGAGALVVEAAVIIPSRSSYNLRISDDSYLPGLTDLVKAVREEDQKVNPVRNSSGALNPAGIILKCNPAAEQRGIISNGVKMGIQIMQFLKISRT